MNGLLAPSQCVELLCRLVDELAGTIGPSTVTVRAARSALDASWTGPASTTTLAEVDRLLAERSSIAHALLDFVVGAWPLIPILQAAETAHSLICVLDVVNLAATVAAVVELGLNPVADAMEVASQAGVAAAVAAGKAELITFVRLQLRREVFATTLAGVARRTTVNLAAMVGWTLGADAVVDVASGRVAGVALPGWSELPDAVGWSIVGGRRGPGPEVPTHVGPLDLSDHLDVRHNSHPPAWLIRRLQGGMPELGRTPGMATSFITAHDVEAALEVVRAHLPQLLGAMATEPGRRVKVLLPLPAGIGVRGWKTVKGVLVPIPSSDLRHIRVIVSSKPGDHGIVSIMADHISPRVPA